MYKSYMNNTMCINMYNCVDNPLYRRKNGVIRLYYEKIVFNNKWK